MSIAVVAYQSHTKTELKRSAGGQQKANRPLLPLAAAAVQPFGTSIITRSSAAAKRPSVLG